MNSKNFSDAMNELDSRYVDEAIGYKATVRKHTCIKWGTVAACLCLAVGCIVMLDLKKSRSMNRETAKHVYTLPQAEKMSVKFVEMSGDHFKAVTVDVGNSEIFPINAELSIVFDYDTEIFLNDGTRIVFNPDEPDTGVIDWETGTLVDVEFVNYTEYLTGNHFYNQVCATRVAPAK